MFPRKSTAISDAVLASTCIYALIVLVWQHQGQDSSSKNAVLAAIWFALALASTVIGGFRYVVVDFFQQLGSSHAFFSWLVLAVGLPCLTAQFYLNSQFTVPAQLHLMLILPPVLSCFSKSQPDINRVATSDTNRVTGFTALVCILSLIGHGAYTQNYFELAAALVMVSASRGFDTSISDRNMLGLAVVDWLHYSLALANILLVGGLCDHLPGIEDLRQKVMTNTNSMFT